MVKPRTVGDLRAQGWQRKSVKQELRDNLIAKLRKSEAFLPGIVGYDETVVPQIENAILSGQDVIFLGERGQAKTRIARLLVGLLDDEMPALAGCEINDDPLAPICQACRVRIGEQGNKAEIEWIPRAPCGDHLERATSSSLAASPATPAPGAAACRGGARRTASARPPPR